MATHQRGNGPHKKKQRRISFATKLMIGGITLALVIIVSTTSVLLISRNGETNGAAQTNSDNRAHVMVAIQQRITSPLERYAAVQISNLPALSAALGTTGLTTASASSAVSQVVAKTDGLFSLQGESLTIYNATGTNIYTTVPSTQPDNVPTDPLVHGALQGQSVEGVEFFQSTGPVYNVAVPICPGSTSAQPHCDATKVVGVVLYTDPLAYELHLFGSIIGGYQTAFIFKTGGKGYIIRPHCENASCSVITNFTSPMPAILLDNYKNSAKLVHGIYSSSTLGTVAGSFAPVSGPYTNGSYPTAGFVGVEIPLSTFQSQQVNDDKLILWLGILGLLITMFAVLYFVHRFVSTPVYKLEASVAKIAGGDYTSDVPHVTNDELGDLADSVNVMKDQIAEYIGHIDASITRLGEVSRALTTTTTGVDRLATAVVRAAALMVGGNSTAFLYSHSLEGWRLLASINTNDGLKMLDVHHFDQVASIESGKYQTIPTEMGKLLVIPMRFQDAVVGTLVVIPGRELAESDDRALVALANYAAIAMENTRLYEREKETVVKLTELDRLKSDFLSTMQHEMRTPVMTIMGQSELMEIGWDSWDEKTKLSLIKDLHTYSRQLNDIVQTLVDFSLISAETLSVTPRPTPLAQALQSGIDQAKSLFPEPISVPIHLHCDPTIVISAEPQRFEQVIRAVVHNSAKFTLHGSITIAATTPDHGVCQITVKDTGIGIQPEAIEHVFEQFYQEDNSKTRSFGGMGMGLSLAKSLTEAQGGNIAVSSNPEDGTLVTITWPAITDSLQIS